MGLGHTRYSGRTRPRTSIGTKFPAASRGIGSGFKTTSAAPGAVLRALMETPEQSGNKPRAALPPAPLNEGPEAAAARETLEPLRQEIQDQLIPLLRPETRGQADLVVDRLMTTISEKFSGPVAHPAYLEAYERILPGAAERLFQMAEGEQGHRHRNDRHAATFESIYAMTGLTFGFLIGIGLVAGGVAVALSGESLVGSLFAGASAVGMVSAFIRGRSRSNQSTPGIQPPPADSPPHTREFQRTDQRHKSRQRN